MFIGRKKCVKGHHGQDVSEHTQEDGRKRMQRHRDAQAPKERQS